MAWTTIPDTDIDPDSPLTTGLMTAYRDNFLALANGDAGAPDILEAALAAAVTAQLVTNGDSHNHSGGDGASIPNASVTGLGALALLSSVGAAQIDAGAVATEYAATSAGAVGSFSIARNTATTNLDYGGTIAGSSLVPTNAASTSTGTALSGTWRCLGKLNTGTSEGLTSIWLRIS